MRKSIVLKKGLIQGLLALSVFILIFLPLPASAQMTVVADDDLSEMTGHGFSSFTIVGDTARAEFDIAVGTYTTIDSLKMGYYNDSITTGWDEDWTSVELGSPSEDITFHGIYIEAIFNNIDDPATRTLQSLKVGTPDISGAVSADFSSFSGDIAAGDTINGHRLNPAFTEISFTNTGLYISLSQSGTEKGFWVHWDNASTL